MKQAMTFEIDMLQRKLEDSCLKAGEFQGLLDLISDKVALIVIEKQIEEEMAHARLLAMEVASAKDRVL